MDNRNVISLFSGAMGLDIGLARAGLNIVIGQDFDAKKEAEALIAKAMEEEAVARLMERNAMRILRKEMPDLMKDVEKRVWMELHAGIRKDRQDNQKDIGSRK